MGVPVETLSKTDWGIAIMCAIIIIAILIEFFNNTSKPNI